MLSRRNFLGAMFALPFVRALPKPRGCLIPLVRGHAYRIPPAWSEREYLRQAGIAAQAELDRRRAARQA